jgi:hypothetical protein
MKSLAIGMALALLAGQGLAFADERADLLDWVCGLKSPPASPTSMAMG